MLLQIGCQLEYRLIVFFFRRRLLFPDKLKFYGVDYLAEFPEINRL